MRSQRRAPLTREQKQELWGRWKQGESAAEIARALDRFPDAVRTVLMKNGGIVPPARSRSASALTLAERERISRGLALGQTIRGIAAALGRAASTISREVQRHGGREAYRATAAEERAWTNGRRPKRCRLASHGRLRRLVASKLKAFWSPRQIAGWLKLEYPSDKAMQISHETIYRSLFIQARGVLKKELLEQLRLSRRMRRSKLASAKHSSHSRIVDAVSISQRPPEADDRAVPGHWEGDLLAGANNTHIATLVERHSRFTMLVKVKGKDTQSVVSALSRQVKRLPVMLRKSLTWDRGTEMASHKQFTVATDVQVFFCDPHSPWQRGSNENTNGLLRQYFPKGTDLSSYTQAQLDKVARSLNQRPRETLGFRTPAARLQATVAMTG
ncbi:MAG TPA: IS30 family transposase [Sphingomicrobium sp.]|nr:IS30 family transposase [Sphingomicrobium sp.]